MPPCASVFDEVNQREIFFRNEKAVEEYLIKLNPGKLSMLLLRGVKDWRVIVISKFPIKMEIVFPEKLFP
ncbi:MAG: hypothetical protein NT118_14210 [Lentisphaerae bacterium]|nr:hypothetical protein [Lentisphaerota bacterium]